MLKIGNFGATLALPGDDFLGVALVETIDKRLIFGIDTTTNRLSAMRAFQSTTHCIRTTATRKDIEEKVILIGLDGLE